MADPTGGFPAGDVLEDAGARKSSRRTHLVDQLAALAGYGQPDDDPRVIAARAELAALDDVDQADAPAPAPTRKARRGSTQAP
ncbi:hypothetical protein OOK41_01325 [Micromonospora sp. NBC_01655]|uniref:hypothetical protein n=1 Tax=Micromonospora sp. NBC_01655 TaxID=2975983 RepID=UPI0022575DEC|nr:hypothetical protein [Micromonospora sp. NBC_01655]MCX4468965.1 hypothetical protein [Micromonospora sp. NBC_01655]